MEYSGNARIVKAVDSIIVAGYPTVPVSADAGMERLIGHLNANLVYYSAAIISGGDAGLRYMATAQLRDWRNESLADVIENTVVGFVGNYAAFPLKGRQLPPGLIEGSVEGEETWPTIDEPSDPDERIITLTTPGIFAESQLGSCTSCEKIDITRLWDWQKSPCSEQAPEITADMLASRYQNLSDLVEIIKSDLQPTPVQIPEEPEPMIKIGDETLKELVKGLNLTDAKDVLGFIGGLAQIGSEHSLEVFKTIWASYTGQGMGGAGGGGTGTGGGGGTGSGGGTGLPASETVTV
jgi:hypothetical protein